MHRTISLWAICVFSLVASATAFGQSGSQDSWTGFYAGGYVGGAASRAGLTTTTPVCTPGPIELNGCYFHSVNVPVLNATGRQNLKTNAFTGGGQVGYNYQAGRAVFGVESDLGVLRNEKSVIATGTYLTTGDGNFTISQAIKTDWLLTVRPRIGVTAGKALIYGTGGLAVTKGKYQLEFRDFSGRATGENDEAQAGYAAGGGVEVKVAKRWSLKGEYLFTNAKTSATSDPVRFNSGSRTFPDSVFNSETNLKVHSFRFGVNYHF